LRQGESEFYGVVAGGAILASQLDFVG